MYMYVCHVVQIHAHIQAHTYTQLNVCRVCVCAHVCLYMKYANTTNNMHTFQTYTPCTHVCMHAHIHTCPHTRTCTHTCMHVHVHIHTCMYAWHAYTHVCAHTHACIQAHNLIEPVCVSVYICVCMCVCLCVCILSDCWTHTQTHKYTVIHIDDMSKVISVRLH